MKFSVLDPLREVLVVEASRHEDERGSFRELFHRERLQAAGVDLELVQVNLSRSRPGVLRGLHFQHPGGQGKLVTITGGALFDVAVDVRVGSPTFGRWAGRALSVTDPVQLWIPAGFAHGFLVLGHEPAEIVYGCTAPYRPESEHVLSWDDLDVGIEWPVSGTGAAEPLLSPKDRCGTSLSELEASGALPPWRP